jgi:SAM-dependent methyltransferase
LTNIDATRLLRFDTSISINAKDIIMSHNVYALREQVRERYATAAKTITSSQASASCADELSGCGDSSGCCAPTGLDTDEMLDLARANAAQAAATNVEFLKATIEDIPLPAESVDVVISNCVINLSVDKPKVLNEMFSSVQAAGWE